MKKYVQEIKSVLLLSITLMIICGVIYPLVVTGISQVAFPTQANGSLVELDGKKVGSKLIGQSFTSPKFLVGRPSAVNYNVYSKSEKAKGDYTGVASGSTNLSANNPALVTQVEKEIADFLHTHPNVKPTDLPGDLFTSSGSGLDPHISPSAAAIQVPQLASNTGLTEETIQGLIQAHTSSKLFGIFGEETVNVLAVNMAIAEMLN